MITINLTSDDLVKMRFAYRPVIEVAYSYRILNNPAQQAGHRRWVEEAQRALSGVELPHMAALITANSCCIPGFLCQMATTSHTTIEADCEDLLAISDKLIRRNVQELIQLEGDSEVRQFFLTHPRDAVRCLVEELCLYWRRTLAHEWSRMTSILEGDILYRARVLALEGHASLFEDLHPTIAYQQNQIQITQHIKTFASWLNTSCRVGHFFPSPYSQCAPHTDLRKETDDGGMRLSENPVMHPLYEASLNGVGIQLVPSVFSDVPRWQIDCECHPCLSYPVRGVGAYCQKPSSASLELALGAMRAQVLEALKTPATTSELTYKLHLSAGSVSEHLSRLTKAGLIHPQRSGKRVYYSLTERGENLLVLFDTMD